jgi:hypothetical protein
MQINVPYNLPGAPFFWLKGACLIAFMAPAAYVACATQGSYQTSPRAELGILTRNLIANHNAIKYNNLYD